MNALLRGDALTLPARLSRLEGLRGRLFDLVYLDPPFNAGGAFSARLEAGQGRGRGRRGSPVAFDDAWGGLDAFLAMLAPRLSSLRELMAEDATLWLHLDARAVHDAKVMTDGVFGRGAFRGEIIWTPGNGARGAGLPSTHQTLLVYTRSREPGLCHVWNRKDAALREPFAPTSLAMHFTRRDESGRLFRERVIGGKSYRYYADEGRQLGSVWTDLPAMTANTPLRAEGTGYPTQKPLALLERIVRAATRPGGLVLDPMCGSGTALEAAHRLGRSFVGNDVGELALRIARERLGRAGAPFAVHEEPP